MRSQGKFIGLRRAGNKAYENDALEKGKVLYDSLGHFRKMGREGQMILKRGVTGFTAGDVAFEYDWGAKVSNFKRYCYLYVQQLNGKVLAWHEPDIDIHYAHARIKVDYNEFYIFHHSMYDYIAFTNNRLITGLEFIDFPPLAMLFNEPFQVLTVAQLEEPLRKQAKGDGHILLNDNDLNEIELYYMDYFSAQTVGDLVFNYWD